MKLLDGDAFYLTALVVLLAAWLFLRMLAASRFGRVLSAIRQNRARVEALGFNAFAAELVAMAGAAMICAVAGVLLANEAEYGPRAGASWARSGCLIAMGTRRGDSTLQSARLGSL